MKPTLKTISDLVPGGIKAIETRPMQECKQVSAYVVFDPGTDAAVVYLEVPLAWIDEMKLTNLGIQTIFDKESLERNSQADTPQVVTIGSAMYLNRYTSLRFLLIAADNSATHITIPWPPNAFDEFKRKRPLLFVSLQDSSFHLNGNLDAGSRDYLFKRYVSDILK